MEDKGLERPDQSWTGLRLNDLPGWVAPTPCSDRPLVVLRAPWSGCLLLVPLLLFVPAYSLNQLLILVVVVVVVVLPLLWLWTALLHLLVALQARPALRHERVEGDAHLLLGQLHPAPSGRSFHLAAIIITSFSEDPKIFELVLQVTGKAIRGVWEAGLQHCCVLRPLEHCQSLLPNIRSSFLLLCLLFN